MAEPNHKVKRIGTIDLILDVEFHSGRRPSIMIEKEFEVMEGIHDFIFGVDMIPELYPDYSKFLLDEMFDRQERPLLTPPIIYSEERRREKLIEHAQMIQMFKEKQNDKNQSEIHVCRVQLSAEEEMSLLREQESVEEERGEEMSLPIESKSNEIISESSETLQKSDNEAVREIDEKNIGPADFIDPVKLQDMKNKVDKMDSSVFLDESFQTIRQQLLEDGFGTILQSELPNRPETTTTVESEEIYSKHRKQIEESIKSIKEISENIEGYCTHPMSKVRITMKKDFDINKLSQQQYKIAFSLWPAIIECLERWYSKNKVEDGDVNEKVNNPLLPVPKKADDGTMAAMRLCYDLRKINEEAADEDKFELPSIPEMLRRIGENKIFSQMDLSEAFTQFEIEKDSRRWLTFRFLQKVSQSRCMPYGYKSAPGIFQRGSSTMLADIISVSVFIDNLIVASNTFEEHERECKKVINRLIKWNLKLKKGATEICHSQLKILGHLISHQGIGMDPAKVSTVLAWQLPEEVANLRAFLGFANFLSDHVRHFAEIAAPLYEVKNKTGKIVWTEQMKKSFKLIKRAIATAPWLTHPDFTKQFVLATDASWIGAGCVLYQPENDGLYIMTATNIIAIYSHKFNEAQLRYSIYKKETFSPMLGFKRFHQYLYLQKFVLITDHKPLEYLLRNKDIPPSIQQWTDTILNYQFVVVHRPGVLHVLPDAVSRMYEAAYDEDFNMGNWHEKQIERSSGQDSASNR